MLKNQLVFSTILNIVCINSSLDSIINNNSAFVRRRKNEAQIFLDYFEGKSAEHIIYEMGKARARLQPSGDIIVPTLVLKKIVIFTESEMDDEAAYKLYLDGYLSTVKK